MKQLTYETCNRCGHVLLWTSDLRLVCPAVHCEGHDTRPVEPTTTPTTTEDQMTLRPPS